MPKLVPIVEGNGEVKAVPILLYKLLHALQRFDIQVAPAKSAYGRDNLLKPGGVEKYVRHAWREKECGAIIILLDAEEDCPLTLACDLAQRVAALGVLYPVTIVCATRRYEGWLAASWESLNGQPLTGREGLTVKKPPVEDADSIKSPKNWLNDQLPPNRTYKETDDQETLTRLLDLDRVHSRSRSFRRLWHAIEQAIEAIDTNAKIVTPVIPDITHQTTSNKKTRDKT